MPDDDHRNGGAPITDGGGPIGHQPGRAHHPQATPEVNPQAHREAHLGPHSHHCDICDREFETLDELADHDCQPVRTDGGESA